MKQPETTKEDYNEMWNNLEIIDTFLLGAEVTGKDDIYSVRQRLFKLKNYLVKKI